MFVINQISFWQNIYFNLIQVKKSNLKVTDLLRPAVPLLKSNVAEISDDLASVGGISQQLSDLDLLAYSWDFDHTEVAPT